MATHCSVLAWRIPGMGEPGGLPSMGSHRVGHDWSDLAAAAAGGASAKEPACQCRRHKIPGRRKWQPTPVFLSGGSRGQRSLVGYGPWGCKELDTTESDLAHSIAQLILVLRVQEEGQVRNSNGRVRKRMAEERRKRRDVNRWQQIQRKDSKRERHWHQKNRGLSKMRSKIPSG